MRGLFAVALGAGALALAGAARAAAPPSLATPWPQQTGCSSFSGADVSVDDRVRAVEWRGPNGASFVIEVTPAADQYNHEAYASGSEGLDCHRDLSSCIVYRGGAKVRNVRVARGSQRVPPDFAPGAYTELVLRDDVRAAIAGSTSACVSSSAAPTRRRPVSPGAATQRPAYRAPSATT
jgi:hypothetical protein